MNRRATRMNAGLVDKSESQKPLSKRDQSMIKITFRQIVIIIFTRQQNSVLLKVLILFCRSKSTHPKEHLNVCSVPASTSYTRLIIVNMMSASQKHLNPRGEHTVWILDGEVT
jgi:hypothetical protein